MFLVTENGLKKALSPAFKLLLLALFVVALGVLPAFSQGQPAQKPESTQTPEAGGPQGDLGPIAVPRREPAQTPPPQKERPEPFQNPEGLEDFALRVDVPLVNVDVSVRTRDGLFIPGLKQEHFRVLEDGVPQQIVDFRQTEAPITAVLLVEFANTNYYFMIDALNASYSFAATLKPEDWIAVMAYDMRTELLADFTQDKRNVYGALGRLRIPGFSETNLFDALYETLDRLDGVEGKKFIILVSSGIDTFSKRNYDHVLRKVQEAKDTTIYSVGTGQAFLLWAEGRGMLNSGATRMTFVQAENQMRTFARLTGGRSYFPRFDREFAGVFQDIGNTIRNQYTISYRPSNSKQDGTYRKVKVELLDPEGKPLRIANEKGKNLRYDIYAREGYRARMEVE